jgi:hypothetical protein
MIKAKENAIKAIEKNIAELKEEHKQVQTAAAKFSLYLKHNSITHYNDATVEYLEYLIRDERTKVRTGQSRARLESLEKDLDDYNKFVEAMEQKDNGVDGADAYAPLNEAGVAKLVQKLYNLPHYGQMLKDLAQVVANAYEANFRERPYRISRRSVWRDYLDGQGQRGSNGGSVFGRKKSVRNPFMAPSTTSRLARTSSPNELNGISSGWSEKLMGPAPRQREETGGREFWPQSEKQGASSAGPVRSIMDWDNSCRRTGPTGSAYHGATNSFDVSGPFSAPPPYPGPGGGAQINGGQQGIVERKGVWVRLKDKLRKK